MQQGHIIEIHEDYDQKQSCFTARVELKEFRQGRQYGGTAVWEHTGKTKGVVDEYTAFRDAVVDLVKREVLSLISYKIK